MINRFADYISLWRELMIKILAFNLIVESRFIKHLRRVNQLGWLKVMGILLEELGLSPIVYLKFLQVSSLWNHPKHLILCVLVVLLELLHAKSFWINKSIWLQAVALFVQNQTLI